MTDISFERMVLGIREARDRDVISMVAVTIRATDALRRQFERGSAAAVICRPGFEERKLHRLAFAEPFSPVVKRRFRNPALAPERPNRRPSALPPAARDQLAPKPRLLGDTLKYALQSPHPEERLASRLHRIRTIGRLIPYARNAPLHSDAKGADCRQYRENSDSTIRYSWNPAAV